MPRERAGAARRALRVGLMTQGVAGSYVGYFLQRAFLGADRRREKLSAAHSKAARRVTSELQQLRGPMMKVGQALSLQSDLLPEEVLKELSQLQMKAPGMHPSLARSSKGAWAAIPKRCFARSSRSRLPPPRSDRCIERSPSAATKWR
jgi:predicted unusual protein kinase regulating ubiquinone biosynthesis (AarF/ABC1/UbiB family)